MHQAGLMAHALRKVEQQYSKNPCSLYSKDKQQENEHIFLKLNEFSGAFLVLGTGLGFSFAVLIAELIIDKCRIRSKK